MEVPLEKLGHHEMHEKLQQFKKEMFVKQSLVVFDIAELYITSKTTIGGINGTSLMLHIRLVSNLTTSHGIATPSHNVHLAEMPRSVHSCALRLMWCHVLQKEDCV